MIKVGFFKLSKCQDLREVWMVVKWNHHFNISEQELLKLSFFFPVLHPWVKKSNVIIVATSGIEKNTWTHKILGIALGRPDCDTGQDWERGAEPG